MSENNGPLTVKDQLEMPWPQLWSMLLKRPVALVSKMIGIRGLAMAVCTALVLKGAIDGWHWIIFIGAVVLGQKALDHFKK